MPMASGACVTRDLHFVLRYSDKLHGQDTIGEHVKVLKKRGYVWLGKFGLGIASNIVEKVNKQVAEGRLAYVYLSSNTKVRYRATILDVRGGGQYLRLPPPEQSATPSYYLKTPCSIWFKLGEIAECSCDELAMLRLYNSPGLAPAFTSMRGLVYVTLCKDTSSPITRSPPPRHRNPQKLDFEDAITLEDVEWLVG
jgi:hypothetical protein